MSADTAQHGITIADQLLNDGLSRGLLRNRDALSAPQ